MRGRNVGYIIILILRTSNKDILETRVANHMAGAGAFDTREPGKHGMSTSESRAFLRETGVTIGTMESI